MRPTEIVEHLLSSVAPRKEIWGAALDRGLGQGMQIEKWVLIEMIPRLKELQAQGHITHGESEHKYPIKKTTRYEHCDVWWQQDDDEHWLEVKTIVLTESAQLGSIKDTVKDLDKMNRLRRPFHFHHLGIVFGVSEESLPTWKKDLASTYTQHGLSFEGEWKHHLWEDKTLYSAFFGLDSV